MSVFSSLNTAVGGLRAQSTSLGHISDNIANSTTLGYKRTETNFRDLVTTSNSRLHSPGSVIAQPKFVNNVQGELSQSQTQTHMAVSGNGYFVVSEPQRFEGDDIIFRNEEFYTRRGDFELDRFGNLVNGAGYYLNGRAVIDQESLATTDVVEQVNVATTTTDPVQTTRVRYNANLPANASTVTDPAADYNGGTPVSPADPITTTADSPFIRDSSSGGAITVYDDIGTPYDIQFRWLKTGENDTSDPAVNDEWTLYFDQTGAVGNEREWVEVEDFEFPGGRLDAGQALEFNFPAGSMVRDFDISGVSLDLSNNSGDSGLTQFSDDDISVFRLDQNGFRAGVMTNVFVDENGYVTASFDNGVDRVLYQVPLALFNAENELNRKDGAAYFRSPESGTPRYEQMGRAGAGTINGSALEGSNVDIADEFTKMIIAQRTYSANTRVITTSDEMLQEVINAKR
jgi:flagellar hook protein FlgE